MSWTAPGGSGQELDVPVGTQVLAVRPGEETVRITDACTACGACLATCPERALVKAPKRPSVVDAACTACWACIEICPAGAIVEVAPERWTGPAAGLHEVRP